MSTAFRPLSRASGVLFVLVSGAVALGALALARSREDATDPAVKRAICVLEPRSGSSVRGTVRFSVQAEGVLVEAEVSGLEPGLHGFHVHEFGDLECGDGMCTGGHFNPTGAPHGGPDDLMRHVGDLGNLEADASGVARYRRVDRQIRLDGPLSIIGRGLIVHAKPDDLKTQPTGDAGARQAAGVIGIAGPEKKKD